MQSLFKLAKHLHSLGFHAAANQSLWLLKLAGYDDEFRSTVNRISKNNKPFKKWFGDKDRLYFDFTSSGNIENYQIEGVVSEPLEEAGYKITDYIAGYCTKDNRIFKIGKILKKLQEQEIKELNNFDLIQDEIPAMEEEINDKWQSIINVFINSEVRRAKKHSNNLMIVISQDSHDIAQMSYGRNWDSCMNIEDGSKSEDLFCEIAEGGLVAYLTTREDKDIKNPLARISIKRYGSKHSGLSLAKAENSIYGNSVLGFKEFVKKWLQEKNSETLQYHRTYMSHIGPAHGVYKRKGGEYSDTLGDIHLEPPADKDTLLKWYNKEDPILEEVYFSLYDRMYDDLVSNYEEAGILEEVNVMWEDPDSMNNLSEDDLELNQKDIDGTLHGPGTRNFETKEDAEYFIEKLNTLEKKYKIIEALEDAINDSEKSFHGGSIEKAISNRFRLKKEYISDESSKGKSLAQNLLVSTLSYPEDAELLTKMIKDDPENIRSVWNNLKNKLDYYKDFKFIKNMILDAYPDIISMIMSDRPDFLTEELIDLAILNSPSSQTIQILNDVIFSKYYDNEDIINIGKKVIRNNLIKDLPEDNQNIQYRQYHYIYEAAEELPRKNIGYFDNERHFSSGAMPFLKIMVKSYELLFFKYKYNAADEEAAISLYKYVINQLLKVSSRLTYNSPLPPSIDIIYEILSKALSLYPESKENKDKLNIIYLKALGASDKINKDKPKLDI